MCLVNLLKKLQETDHMIESSSEDSSPCSELMFVDDNDDNNVDISSPEAAMIDSSEDEGNNTS